MDKKKTCKKIKINAETNSKPPTLTLVACYKSHELKDNAKRVLEIDKENMELLKSLYIISQTKGTMGETKTSVKTVPTAANSRLKKNEKILKENIEMYNRIQQIVSSLSYYRTKPKKNKIKKGSRIHQRCFFEVANIRTKQTLGEIEIELYEDIVPKICEKFKSFCSDTKDVSYRGTVFYQIIQGYLCQIIQKNKVVGTSDTLIEEEKLEDNNSKMKHSGAGILSLCKNDANNFVVNITFTKLEVLDGKDIVFGKVIKGISNLYKIESAGTKVGRPRDLIIITNCGLR